MAKINPSDIPEVTIWEAVLNENELSGVHDPVVSIIIRLEHRDYEYSPEEVKMLVCRPKQD